MREETANWLKQARANFDAANANCRDGVYFVAAFLSQQSAEAALKALCIHRNRKLAASHNLRDLGDLAGAPKELLSDLLELNPDYVISRYPDAANGVPAEMYDAKKADRKLVCAKRILDWVEECLKK